MTQVNIDYIEDKNGNKVAPITHVNAVRDSEGNTLTDILDRDYPTTSKTPVEGSTEVSLVTRGEKYNYDKVNNATDVSGASGIGADFKYLLLNGTTGEFEQALESYVNEKVRSAIGSLINNLDKGTGVKAVAGIDSNNDLGTITTANLASVLGVFLHIFFWNITTTATGDVEQFFSSSSLPNNSFIIVRLGAANPFFKYTSTEQGNIGGCGIGFKWDANAGFFLMSTHSSYSNLYYRRNDSTWSTWKPLF